MQEAEMRIIGIIELVDWRFANWFCLPIKQQNGRWGQQMYFINRKPGLLCRSTGLGIRGVTILIVRWWELLPRNRVETVWQIYLLERALHFLPIGSN